MKMYKWPAGLGALLILWMTVFVPGSIRETYSKKDEFAPVPARNGTWIVQWKNRPNPDFIKESKVTASYDNGRVTVAQPMKMEAAESWLKHWSQASDVDFVEADQSVSMAKIPNDPLISNQSYLQQIHAPEAWNAISSNRSLTIAIVDTGVQLNHPDLKDNLVSGVNLVKPGTPPEDDNGHGTNVAGVIAAIADNDKGTAGILWKAKIMPIKALGADGNGDESVMGEGIRYAVDHGAKIVVLSLGLNKYSKYMEEITDYAEKKGVLLVAASGNEGSAVKYPAAYETVLAVGGVDAKNVPVKLSNSGPELDIVAPWVVFTTGMGGKYEYKDGTSMAAPQAAAVAALVWGRFPNMSPEEVRDFLKQTAEDLGSKGWNRTSGYGLLRADQAMKQTPKTDRFEPNDSQALAYHISIGKPIQADLEPGGEDWYSWELPYDGSVHLKLIGLQEGQVSLTLISEETREEQSISKGLTTDGITLHVKKGRYELKIKGNVTTKTSYELIPHFSIYKDAFEDNDRQYQAYMLSARSQMLIGTFDRMQDQDWFSIEVKKTGRLTLKVTPDTGRMDPVLLVQRKGGTPTVIDDNGDKEAETAEIPVSPGIYYFRVSNIDSYSYPVAGEYLLGVQLATDVDDPFEPNDKAYEATRINSGENVYAALDKADTDWYFFRVDGESKVNLSLSPSPDLSNLNIQLYNASLRPQSIQAVQSESGIWSAWANLRAGGYYVNVTSKPTTFQQPYTLRMNAQRLVEGYVDLYNHWAEKPIVKMIQDGYIKGYGTNQFYPNQPMTRAEAVTLLDKVLKLPSAAPPPYKDVTPNHWAYSSIARATKAKLVAGYSSAVFAPDRSISRMEMAEMLANAVGLKGTNKGKLPFKDVKESYWGAPVLRELSQKGWISGYSDSTFRPDRVSTRAEFISLLVKMLKL